LFWQYWGFELRASHLLGGCSTTCATLPALLALAFFEIGSFFKPELAWTSILLFMLPLVGTRGTLTGMCQHAQTLVEMGFCEHFAKAELEW
jgi:hypothetical protein